ncbi:MAG: PrsW family intramembrane metalloprotease [Bacilli bacterium]|nr:PrsW family intramembrane metalloprotease [Bacilli bacterium]
MGAFAGLSIVEIIVVLAITILPSILMFGLIMYSDRKSREPVTMILIAVLSGVFTICISLLIDKYILKSNFFTNLFNTYKSLNLTRIAILALVEEFAKLTALYVFISHNKAYDDIYDGFVYSAVIALSFALIETFLYVIREDSYTNMSSLALLRNFTTIPLHITCGIVMGYYVSISKFSRLKEKKFVLLLKGLLIPMLIHTTYNLFFSIITDTTSTMMYNLLLISLFVISIYLIGILYIVKITDLNKIFINNRIYPKRFRFLMNKREYILKGLNK